MEENQKDTKLIALIIISALLFGIIGLCFSVSLYLIAKFIYDKVKKTRVK